MRESRYWVLHLAAGVAMVVLLGIHMAVFHLKTVLGYIGFDGGDVLAFDAVMARATRGSWTLLYVALLVLALYHGLYGLRGVLLELSVRGRGERLVTGLLVLAGLVLFAFGGYVTVKSFMAGGV